MNHSKRYREDLKKLDRSKTYSVDEAIAWIKESRHPKFDEGVEVHLHLGIDPSKAEQIVRGTLTMPNRTGKIKKVIAFVPPEKETEAKEAGADLIGDKAKIAAIQSTGKVDFDVAVAHPGMMRDLAPIAKILGQKGRMPNPKTETVGPHIGAIIAEVKKGKVAFRNDDTGNLHFLVGRVSAAPDQLKANIEAVLDTVKRTKPSDVKGTFLQTVVVCSTMGPGLRLSI